MVLLNPVVFLQKWWSRISFCKQQ